MPNHSAVQSAPDARKPKAQTDLLALGIAVAATIMVAGIAGSALGKVFQNYAGTGAGPDTMLTNALLLNVALVIFGWRRYEDLHGEVVEHRETEAKARLMAQTDALTGCLKPQPPLDRPQHRRPAGPRARARRGVGLHHGRHQQFQADQRDERSFDR